MLSIIWMIVKIILLLLAAVLALALLVLAVLLFVPIRYEAHIKKDEKFLAEAKAHWFLRLVRLPVTFRDGQLSAKLKIFLFTIKDFLAEEEETKDSVTESFGSSKDDSRKSAPDKVKSVEASNDTPVVPAKPPAAKESKAFPGEFFHFLKFILHFLHSIPGKFRKLRYTIHTFYVKMNRIQRFAADERTKAGLGLLYNQLKVLLGRLLPKKISGNLHFGTEDPALTGEILGGIAAIYPLFMDQVKVVPDFQETVLEGELYLKGRMRLITLARIAWKLYRDKNVRFIYRMVT